MGRCQEDIIILYARDNNIVIILCYLFIHCFFSVKLTNFAHDYEVVKELGISVELCRNICIWCQITKAVNNFFLSILLKTA